MAAASIAALLAAMAPAGAQVTSYSVDEPVAASPAAPRAGGRRNDAYRPTEPGTSLGTLTTAQAGGSDPYAARPQPGGTDGYAPRYGEPTRPYASGGDPSQGGAPAASGGTGSYARGYPGSGAPTGSDAYRPAPGGAYAQSPGGAYPPPQGGGYAPAPYQGAAPYQGQPTSSQGAYGQPYSPPPEYGRDRAGYDDGPRTDGPRVSRGDSTYSSNEIMHAGQGFFGSLSQGLASVVETAFQRQGRPNGYILGDEGGGAFIAGLRYGEGTLYTRDAGTHKVYWQGPSLGYDFGGAGSRVMILVYNLRSTNEIYERFGGVDGSAYLVGGLGMTLLTRDHITLAPIRTGVGLRLGANVGYLKFTPKATLNPF